MLKYKGQTLQELITKSRTWNAQGCMSYMLYNQGNTNVTINGNYVLTPGMSWSSPNVNPELADVSDVDIQFDSISQPLVKAPDVGAQPQEFDKSWLTGPIYSEREFRYVDDGGGPVLPVDPWAGFELPAPAEGEGEEVTTPSVSKDNRIVIFKFFVTPA